MKEGKYQIFQIGALCREIPYNIWESRLPASKDQLIIIKHQGEGIIIGSLTDYNITTFEIRCNDLNKARIHTLQLSDILEIYEFIKIIE